MFPTLPYPLRRTDEEHTGYKVTSVDTTSYGLTAFLTLAGPACNAFGTDIKDLVLNVTHETSSRLHVHIFDKAQSQFQIPEKYWPRPVGTYAGASDFEVRVNYFSIRTHADVLDL